MKADDILRAGLDTLVQRGVKRDQPDGERSMPRIVHLFHAMTGISLTEREGLLFMVALKLVREGLGAPDADDYIDLANYVALVGEAALSVVNEQLTTAETVYGEPSPCREISDEEIDWAYGELEKRKAEIAAAEADKICATTAHAELQDLLAQRAAQLDAKVLVRPCKACEGTGNCAINRDRYNTPCPACNGTGHRQFMEAACGAT